MTEVTDEMKKRIEELLSKPVNPDAYDSWVRDVPDFAERCNYVPGHKKIDSKED